MPVSLRDQAGREFSRVYSDRFGIYNALVPSTFSYNVPIPSGVSPNMVQVCLNSPFMPDPANPGKFKADPLLQQELHAVLLHLPVPAGQDDVPRHAGAADRGVRRTAAVPARLRSAVRDARDPQRHQRRRAGTLGTGRGPDHHDLRRSGQTQVLNPLYNQDNPSAIGPNGVVEPKTIARDFGFGAEAGQVLFVSRAGTPFETVLPVAPTSWSDSQITVVVPDLGAGVNSATVLVRRAGPNGRTTPRGVTVHVGGPAPTVVTAAAGQKKIQAAIDAATTAGALITVAPGVYEESVILNKRLRLQGFGAGSTFINAIKQPTETQQQWRERVCHILLTETNGADYLLPGQAMPANEAACVTGDTVDNAPLLFGSDEGAGVFVMLRSSADVVPNLQIDGFTITGADQGGGIMVNGYANRLEIANNRITGNQGIEGGGIRIGHANLTAATNTGELRYVGSRNVEPDDPPQRDRAERQYGRQSGRRRRRRLALHRRRRVSRHRELHLRQFLDR